MRFTIKTKLGLAFGGLLTCLAVSGAVGVVSLSSSNDRMQDFAHRPFAQVQRVGQLQADMINSARVLNRSLSENTDAARASVRKSFTEFQADFDTVFKQYVDLVPAEARDANIGPARSAWAAYGAETAKAWDFILMNTQNKAMFLAFQTSKGVVEHLMSSYGPLLQTLKAEKDGAALDSLTSFRLDLETLRLIRYKVVLSSDDESTTAFAKDYAGVLARATATLGTLAQGASPQAAPQVQALRAAFQAYVELDKEVIRLGMVNGDTRGHAGRADQAQGLRGQGGERLRFGHAERLRVGPDHDDGPRSSRRAGRSRHGVLDRPVDLARVVDLGQTRRSGRGRRPHAEDRRPGQ